VILKRGYLVVEGCYSWAEKRSTELDRKEEYSHTAPKNRTQLVLSCSKIIIWRSKVSSLLRRFDNGTRMSWCQHCILTR
jgi:hypothetical protein